MYRLVVERGVQTTQPLATDRPRLVVGRAADCDWVLTEPGVWDRHAAIETRPDGYYLVALSPAASVRVNGAAVSETRLHSGDEIELGAVRLRFELVHGAGTRRRRPSLLSAVAAVVVAAVGLGQLAVVGWILSQPRPHDMQVEARRHLATEPPAWVAAENPAAVQRPDSGRSTPARAPQPAILPEPSVLPRMIDLLQVERSDAADAVLVKVMAKAQAATRDFDVAAAAIAVVPYGVDAAGRTVPHAEPIWLKLPAWENFTVKTLTARFAGPPTDYAGFVVWGFYRGQVQDVAAVPPALLPLARVPPQR